MKNFEKYMDILGNIYGADISYFESPQDIKLILKAMDKAFELGKEDVEEVKLIETEKPWIPFNGKNGKLFNKLAEENCELLFDCGTQCRFNDEQPFSVLTHFR